MKFFHKEGKFRTKILFIIGLMLVGIAAVITLSLFTMKRELFEDRKVKTKHVVESVYGILEHYEGLAKQGKMTTAEAQYAVFELVKQLRYEEKEYFWIERRQDPGPDYDHAPHGDEPGRQGAWTTRSSIAPRASRKARMGPSGRPTAE